MFMSVDLPEPLDPMIATNSPRRRSGRPAQRLDRERLGAIDAPDVRQLDERHLELRLIAAEQAPALVASILQRQSDDERVAHLDALDDLRVEAVAQARLHRHGDDLAAAQRVHAAASRLGLGRLGRPQRRRAAARAAPCCGRAPTSSTSAVMIATSVVMPGLSSRSSLFTAMIVS
jgi:hypothetical protein